ncbi:MAG: hypothetical protein A3F68_05915 [Acidobacteria bacterium RIFCSPLOWO2_12_FULL_54_10]|nr:MAG: hypothetical protein A3F68_05915 [Acidobacteria bacterium RIFCSPLOWO2_12_FULL_54_10]
MGKTLQLEEWEAVAMRGMTRPRDPFQAEFARAVLHSFSIILRIHEELYSYENKRALGDEWRKHSNSLFYLLIEGMRHKQELEKMQLIARKSGYAEIDERLKITAEKLQVPMSKISPLF